MLNSPFAAPTNAATSASNASTSETNAAASYDSFDDRYLGTKSSDPTLDKDGISYSPLGSSGKSGQ